MKHIHSSEFLADSFIQYSQLSAEEVVTLSLEKQCHTLFNHAAKHMTSRHEPLDRAISISVEMFTLSKEEYHALGKLKAFFDRHATSESPQARSPQVRTLGQDDVAELVDLTFRWYDRTLQAEKDDL